MFIKTDIDKDEYGLLFKREMITKILKPNTSYYNFLLNHDLYIKKFNLSDLQLPYKYAEYLFNYEKNLYQKFFQLEDIEDHEIGLFYDDGELKRVLLPKTKNLFIKNIRPFEIKKIPLINKYKLPNEITELLLHTQNYQNFNIDNINEIKIIITTGEEIGIVWLDEKIVEIIKPTTIFGYLTNNKSLKIELCSLKKPLNEKTDLLLSSDAKEEYQKHCIVMEVPERHVGIIYIDNIVKEILPPLSKRTYWKYLYERNLVCFNIEENLTIPTDFLERCISTKINIENLGIEGFNFIHYNFIYYIEVPENNLGILYINDKLHSILKPNPYAFWNILKKVSVKLVDTRMSSLEVSGQEILTKDKVSLRINLLANWVFTDIELAHNELKEPEKFIYQQLQFGLRKIIGTKTLDELLSDKSLIDNSIFEYVASQLKPLGLEIKSVGVKDIILPGEMKEILGKVVEAEKIAQAQIIRRREETSATRSLLNTAKVMENNPVALRLKELEVLEKISERIDKISVFGGLEQILNGLININQNTDINKLENKNTPNKK